MQLEDIKGIGGATAEKMKALGVNSVEEFVSVSDEKVTEISEVVDKPVKTVQGWLESAKGMVGEDTSSEVVEADSEVSETDNSDTGSTSNDQPSVEPVDVVVPKQASSDVEKWIEEVAMPLVEKGHGCRSILYRAGLEFNEDNPRELTKHINQGISVSDNVRLAISKLK